MQNYTPTFKANATFEAKQKRLLVAFVKDFVRNITGAKEREFMLEMKALVAQESL